MGGVGGSDRSHLKVQAGEDATPGTLNYHRDGKEQHHALVLAALRVIAVRIAAMRADQKKGIQHRCADKHGVPCQKGPFHGRSRAESC